MPINLNNQENPTEGKVAKSTSLNSESRTSSIGSLTLYTATIAAVYPTSNTALLNSGDGTYAVFVGNALASFLGISSYSFPEVGTSVLVLRDLNSEKGYDYILGEIPTGANTSDWMSFTRFVGVDNKAYTGLKSQQRFTSQAKMASGDNGTSFMDVVDGERVNSGAYGTILGLLNNLSVLKGTDLAKIECFVLDDLVRIFSEQFEHFSGFGEYKIVNNNGKLDVLWKGTSEEYEAWGLDRDSESKDINIGASNQIDTDVSKISKQNLFYSDGRWRFSSYIGKLGNFIHLLITDPVKTLQLAPDSVIPSGRAEVHVNKDGSIVVRSVSDIVFEKVCRIPVPIANVRPEELDYTKFTLDAFQSWEPFSGPENLFETSYALQDYARWLSNYYSLATFWGLGDSQYTIRSENDTEEPSWYCGDQSMKGPMSSEAETSPYYLYRYATIRIFKDGSIVLNDGYNSTVHMSNGNIELSAAVDINLIAGNNINMVSKNITQLADDEIDISAINRGILLKSKTWMEQYCSDGPILLQSNMNPSTPPDTEDTEAINRYDNAQGSGIILKTLNGASILNSSPTGSVIIQAYSYLNSSYYSVFSPAISFTIKDCLQTSANQLQVTAQTSKFNTLMADGILNNIDKSIVVGGTGQKGLTLVYSGDSGKPSFDFENLMKDASTTPYMLENYNGQLAETSTFKYIPSTDPLVPKYFEIYQSLGQQFVKNDQQVSSDYSMTMFNTSDYGNTSINYPMYPGDPTQPKFWTYTPKLGSLGAPITQTGSQLSQSNVKGTFSQSAYYHMKYTNTLIYARQ